MNGQLELEFYRMPELDNVRKAISLLEEVKAELKEEKDLTVHELWEIHNRAKEIENHSRELRLIAAWNLGHVERERR